MYRTNLNFTSTTQHFLPQTETGSLAEFLQKKKEPDESYFVKTDYKQLLFIHPKRKGVRKGPRAAPFCIQTLDALLSNVSLSTESHFPGN